MPFSADYAREEAFALGVIGGGPSGFPDTLRQFRAHGVPRGGDSLSPTAQTESHEAPPVPVAAPWRLRKFWTALSVGFGVGAAAALLFGEEATSPTPVVASVRTPAAAPAPSVPLPGCVTSPPLVVAAAPSSVAKPPPVTPLLEKRFWLERARSALHNYRLADAERFYQRALAQAPRDSEVLSGLGEVELLRGRQAAADARFREALTANSDYVPARVALADLHWQAGRIEVARSEYRQLVDQYSTDLLPPYVSGRLEGDACAPQCAERASMTPAAALGAPPQ